jgi:uncharacterized protein
MQLAMRGRARKKMILRNITRQTTVAARLTIADTSLARLIGLMGKKRLDPECGLLIKPSSGIHTFGMRFSIDVVALSKGLQVLKLWPALPPFRITSTSLKTHCVLELPAGQINNCRINVGDQLQLDRA